MAQRKKDTKKECLDCTHIKRKKIYRVLLIAVVFLLLAIIVAAAKYKDRIDRHSFTVSATEISDGRGNTIDIHGGGKFTQMGGSGWGPFMWWWNVWIDGGGSITFMTAGEKETARWKPTSGLWDQLTPDTLNFTLKINGKTPTWITAPVTVTLVVGGEPSSGNVIINTGQSTYTGTGTIVIN